MRGLDPGTYNIARRRFWVRVEGGVVVDSPRIRDEMPFEVQCKIFELILELGLKLFTPGVADDDEDLCD